MSESAKTIIKYFCDRFLDLEYYPTSIKAVLQLPIENLSTVNKEEGKKFNENEIETLKDLSKININKLEKFSNKSQININTIQNALIAVNLIANAWSKRKLYLKKPKLKVVIVGLDFAGKTSLINRLIYDTNYNDMANLEPTIGASVEEFQTDKLNLVTWDLGGQKSHIEEYLTEPEKFFIQVDVLIFIFDSQDDRRYDQACQYLTDLVEIIESLNESPYLLILLNKADTDLIDDPDFQIKLEYLSDKITNIFINREKSWNFEIIPTSVFNFYSNEPEIAKCIKSIFSKEAPKKDETITEIDTKLQKILEINLNLMDKVVSELSEIKRVLSRLTPSDLSQSLFSVPFEKVPANYISSMKLKKKVKKDDSGKKKKKGEKIGGVPQRLKTIPTSKEQQELREMEKRIDVQELKKVKESLIHPKSSEILLKSTNVGSLKPPLPPSPPLRAPQGSIKGSQVSRKAIISELKEMFVKRGLVR